MGEGKGEAPNYETFDAHSVVCLTCGAIIAINHMTRHTAWHEGRWQEPVSPKPPRR